MAAPPWLIVRDRMVTEIERLHAEIAALRGEIDYLKRAPSPPPELPREPREPSRATPRTYALDHRVSPHPPLDDDEDQ